MFKKLKHHLKSWNEWRKHNLNPWWFKIRVLFRGRKVSPSYNAYRMIHDSFHYSDYDAAKKFYERKDI